MSDIPTETVQQRLIARIPNILSTFRLLLALYFPFSPEKEWMWLILAGGASDFLDGWIARHWKVESWQGGLLDAIADKLFVLSVLVTFALTHKFSALWIPAVIARDLAVTAIALYVMYRRSWVAFREMDVSRSGKLATACQFTLFLIVLLAPSFLQYILILTALVSILAALDYGKQFIQALQAQAAENESLKR